MLTGDLVRVKIAKQRVVPLYIDREAGRWLARRPRACCSCFAKALE